MTTATHLTLPDLIDGWGRLWSGELDLAPSLVTAEFTVRFGNPAFAADGDAVRGPADLAAFIGRFRTGRDGLRYRTVLERSGPGHAVSVWAADDDGAGLHVGGIDLLELAPDGRAHHGWSVTAGRPLGVSPASGTLG